MDKKLISGLRETLRFFQYTTEGLLLPKVWSKLRVRVTQSVNAAGKVF